jgi:hypothetical protein
VVKVPPTTESPARMSVTMIEVTVLGDCPATGIGIRAVRTLTMIKLRLKARTLIILFSFFENGSFE